MTRIGKSIMLMCLSFSIFAKTPSPSCGAATVGFSGGDGSPANPFLVCYKCQFNHIGLDPTLLSKNFKLGADIDFTNATVRMIGSTSTPFTGNFDGDGYTLSSITLNPKNQYSHIAIFPNVLNATIQNLNINGLTVTLFAGDHVGGLAAQATGSTFNNLHVNGLNIVANDYTGGLIGELTNSSVSSSSVEGVMNQTFGSDASGGLIGSANNVTVNSCSTNVRLLNSYDDPFGVSDIGGMFGLLGFSTVSNVYARGDIDYSNSHPRPQLRPHHVGGLVGNMYNSTLQFAYYAGKIIIQADDVGGVVGSNFQSIQKSNPVQDNVFWDYQLSGILQSAVGLAEDTATMKQAVFWINQGFDSTIWNLVDGQYPTLF